MTEPMPRYSDFDLTDMTVDEINEKTVPELMEPIHRYDPTPGWELTPEQKTSTLDFMRAAQVAKYLLTEAVWHADDQDNEEFFEMAFGFYGPLIDTMIDELDLQRRHPDGKRYKMSDEEYRQQVARDKARIDRVVADAKAKGRWQEVTEYK